MRGMAAFGVGLFLLLSSCSPGNSRPVESSSTANPSVQTSLAPGSCRKEIDRTDPNETPYSVCGGVAGYTLIVRLVDAGRVSVDVVDPARKVFPLNLHEVITRHMTSLESQAEWRLAVKDGKPEPVALIVRVQAHEDPDDPATVTRNYWAIAKIAPSEACVTDRIPEGSKPEVEVRRMADAARDRPCAPPLPSL